jgi:hypothetical protein
VALDRVARKEEEGGTEDANSPTIPVLGEINVYLSTSKYMGACGDCQGTAVGLWS